VPETTPRSQAILAPKMAATQWPDSFAVLLQRHRVAAGLSQEELAERAGLSRRGISDLERGERRSPRLITIRRLAEGLGLDARTQSALLASVHPKVKFDTAEADNALDLSPLPRPLTSFVGRERELAEIKHLLASTRLLTLVGPGGVGKTRLALYLATDLVHKFRDGVLLVELAGIADPRIVPRAIATGLGLRDQPGRPMVEATMAALGVRRLLLVLDNCEHVVGACAALVDQLLRNCVELRVLATSREALAIGGETVWRLPSLSLPGRVGRPPVEIVAQSEAGQLFLARVRAALPSFALTEANSPAIAQICRRTDGIPLALELAAARVSVLSVEQIAERLDDALHLLVAGSRMAPARQQTLRATLDWSYSLLEEREKRLFERLSVFASAWDLEAAEAVCAGDEVEPSNVLNALGRLVDKSLVLAEPNQVRVARYRLLEPLRQYARERLQATPEGERVRLRLADFFLQVAEQAEPALTGPDQQARLHALEKDHDSLRAVLHWALEHRDESRGLRLAVALGRFWRIRGHLVEGSEWLEQLLKLGGTAPQPTAVRAKAETHAGHLAFAQGRWEAAEIHYQSSLAIQRRAGDRLGIAGSQRDVGSVAQAQGEYGRASALYELSLALLRKQRAKQGIAECLNDLGEIARHRSEYERANELNEEALSLQRELGDTWGVARSLRELASVARHRGEYARSLALSEQALELQLSLGDRLGEAYCRSNLALVAQRQGNHAYASSLFECALVLFQDAGDRRGVSMATAGLASIASRNGNMVKARHLAEQALEIHLELGDHRAVAQRLWDLGRFSQAAGDIQQAAALHRESLDIFARLGDRRGMARALEGVASAAMADQPVRAAKLFGAASALRKAIRADPGESVSIEGMVAELRQQLGVEAFDVAWRAGIDLSLERALALSVIRPSGRRAAGLPQQTLRRPSDPFTPWEREVVQLVAQGRTNR
jgi:predicted ATPase/DNA-binding XRE family transcriptional regulator